MYLFSHRELMNSSSRIIKTISFILFAIFLICILTVESHSNERGSLTARCPTCVDSNIHFAIDAQLGPSLGLSHIVAYLYAPFRDPEFSPSIISPNNYRAPPTWPVN